MNKATCQVCVLETKGKQKRRLAQWKLYIFHQCLALADKLLTSTIRNVNGPWILQIKVTQQITRNLRTYYSKYKKLETIFSG